MGQKPNIDQIDSIQEDTKEVVDPKYAQALIQMSNMEQKTAQAPIDPTTVKRKKWLIYILVSTVASIILGLFIKF